MRLRSTTTKIMIFFLAGIFGVAWLTRDKPRPVPAVISFREKLTEGSKKTNIVFQDRTNNCGVAALKMILDHLGHTPPMRDLEHRTTPIVGGTSLQQLMEIAHEFGLQASGWRLTWEDLARVRYPVIMFFRKNHFVVADNLDSSGFLLVRDPAIGTRRLSRSALMDVWAGETLVFSDPPSVIAGATKPGKGK